MKKVICILLIMTMLFTFASCKNSDDDTVISTTKSSENTKDDTENIDETENDLIPELYAPPLKEIDENSVYYNVTQEDFKIIYEGDNEVLDCLEHFCTINYLGMGTMYRTISYQLSFMSLAQMPESSWKQIPDFLDTLTDVQLDYMSYCVFQCFNTAQLIINRDESIMEFVISVTEDADIYSRCTDMQVFRFTQYMFNQFDERGVKYDWTVYDTTYLFVN